MVGVDCLVDAWEDLTKRSERGYWWGFGTAGIGVRDRSGAGDGRNPVGRGLERPSGSPEVEEQAGGSAPRTAKAARRRERGIYAQIVPRWRR